MHMVKIPSRGGAGGGRGAVPTLTAGDVPTVRAAADPGVPAVPGAFGGMDGLAEAAGQVSVTFANIAQKQRTREDTVHLAKSLGKFNNTANDIIQRFQTEQDLSDPSSLAPLGKQLADAKAQALTDYKGSEDGRIQLQADLERAHSAYVDGAGSISAKAQRQSVRNLLSEDISRITDDTGEVQDKFVRIDEIIERYAPALDSGEEHDYRLTARREVIKTAFNDALLAEDVERAKALYDDEPGIVETLSPEDQRETAGRIAALINKREAARTEGLRKIETARQILGRDPTMAERVQLAGLTAPNSTRTPAQELQEIEEALGRKLTGPERAKKLGIDTAASLTDEAGMRKEFTALSKDFVQMRDAYNKVVINLDAKTAPGDMAAVFSIMKILDPGSTVREGEQASARDAKGVPARIMNLYNQAVTGQTLTPEQRQEFKNMASGIMKTQLQSQRQLEENFKALAERKGMNPQDVVLDFANDLKFDAKDDWTPPPVPKRLPKLPASQDEVTEGRWYSGPNGPIIFHAGKAYGSK